jgi:FkbM family methyltransferase
MHTIFASRIVGEAGKVYAFEPAGASRAQLLAHLNINGIRNCIVSDCALGDKDEELSLSSNPLHSGAATFRPEPTTHFNHESCSVRQAGPFLEALEKRGQVLVKIDVEGFEAKVVRGMKAIIAARGYAYYIEITPAWIQELGGDVGEVFSLFGSSGYTCFRVDRMKWTPRGRKVLLAETQRWKPVQANYLFAKEEILARLLKDKQFVQIQRPHNGLA